MGGNAFPGLDVPRLTPEEYKTIRDKCVLVLRNFYEQVVCPPEAPEKIDHGDIDLLVSVPRRPINMDELNANLQSIRRTRVGVTTSFAVPHPTKQYSYAQIDAHACPESYLEWELWMGGYGDLVQILGVLNRGIGLTMNDKGLHVRIPEIEPINRKSSMVYLTNDVNMVMKFLGLNGDEYTQGFSTMDQLFAWCAAGRFYGPDNERADDEEIIAKTSANDRRRFKLRPMFSNFFKVWAPAHPEAFQNEQLTPRETVLREAIKIFGVEAKYNEAMVLWREKEEENVALRIIREAIPEEGERLKQVMRGLKRWTTLQNGIPVLKVENDPSDPCNTQWLRELKGDRIEPFLKWVTENCAELRSREKRRAEAQSNNPGINMESNRD
jgi:hypothetical protein